MRIGKIAIYKYFFNLFVGYCVNLAKTASQLTRIPPLDYFKGVKIYQAIVVSILFILCSIGAARFYGYQKNLKFRQHPLLDQFTNLKFSPDEAKWRMDSYSPLLYVKEEDGNLIFETPAGQENLDSALKSSQKAFLVYIVQDSERINYLLNAAVEKYGLHEKIIVASRFRNILRNIQKMRPRWLTSISPNELFLSIILGKLGLESLSPLHDSVLLLTDEFLSPEWQSELPLDELERRKIYLIAPTKTLPFYTNYRAHLY
tara:strand:- start:1434 stop:2210 length:777 start_codon:yes stop_codon:yes gene_type:complete